MATLHTTAKQHVTMTANESIVWQARINKEEVVAKNWGKVHTDPNLYFSDLDLVLRSLSSGKIRPRKTLSLHRQMHKQACLDEDGTPVPPPYYVMPPDLNGNGGAKHKRTESERLTELHTLRAAAMQRKEAKDNIKRRMVKKIEKERVEAMRKNIVLERLAKKEHRNTPGEIKMMKLRSPQEQYTAPVKSSHEIGWDWSSELPGVHAKGLDHKLFGSVPTKFRKQLFSQEDAKEIAMKAKEKIPLGTTVANAKLAIKPLLC
eukprot:TRINITY_DN102882_c0_g1_i1.p2 TRINITY_DN102882_c0_g1~~TRINITY_DN102882_c0_g1_i1.p2  ORF type:complete len:261 (+),score=40.77 TRINITY_DN102882_c0_g1_i1:46-828(+)